MWYWDQSLSQHFGEYIQGQISHCLSCQELTFLHLLAFCFFLRKAVFPQLTIKRASSLQSTAFCVYLDVRITHQYWPWCVQFISFNRWSAQIYENYSKLRSVQLSLNSPLSLLHQELTQAHSYTHAHTCNIWQCLILDISHSSSVCFFWKVSYVARAKVCSNSCPPRATMWITSY